MDLGGVSNAVAKLYDKGRCLHHPPAGPRGIRLPANVDAVHAVLIRQKVKCDREQAERVAWRIVKDWVEAQMAILESEMVQMDEIFLPYMLNNTGQTVFEAYRNNQLALEGG